MDATNIHFAWLCLMRNVNYFSTVAYPVLTDGSYVCRSDPVLQHVGQDQKLRTGDQSLAAGVELGQAGSPPSDGHDLAVRAGTGIVRDGSIKNLVSTYENKVQEVCVVTNHISNGGNAIASICLSVCFHSIFGTD